MGIKFYKLGLTILTKRQIFDGKLSIISPVFTSQRAKPMGK